MAPILVNQNHRLSRWFSLALYVSRFLSANTHSNGSINLLLPSIRSCWHRDGLSCFFLSDLLIFSAPATASVPEMLPEPARAAISIRKGMNELKFIMEDVALDQWVQPGFF